LKIYSIGGGLVSEWQNLETAVGRYFWNGSDNEGRPVKSGVYILLFKDNKNNSKKVKLVIIR
ncbi:MAG: hypothetical protein KKH98_13165, partial [Spirochaetes bacterium]|nr:hypothetical protein [Spirochaetota bacterium]